MAKTLLIIGMGGFLGSICRYLVSKWVNSLLETPYPWGTFAANIAGCFLLGLVYALAQSQGWLTPQWRWFLAVGFCGSFTTFSTFAYEHVQLYQNGQGWLALGYMLASVGSGVLAVAVGYGLGKA